MRALSLSLFSSRSKSLAVAQRSSASVAGWAKSDGLLNNTASMWTRKTGVRKAFKAAVVDVTRSGTGQQKFGSDAVQLLPVRQNLRFRVLAEPLAGTASQSKVRQQPLKMNAKTAHPLEFEIVAKCSTTKARVGK